MKNASKDKLINNWQKIVKRKKKYLITEVSSIVLVLINQPN